METSRNSAIVAILFVLVFISGCVTPHDYEFNDATNSQVAKLVLTTDAMHKPKWYFVTRYGLQFSVSRLSQSKQEKPLYMGRISLTIDSPRQIISIPAGEPLIISALFFKEFGNVISTCRPSTKLVAEPNGHYEIVLHSEDNVCTLQVISSKDNEVNEHSEMKK